MPDLIPRCINGGGEASRIRLPMVPTIDEALRLGSEALPALHAWQARPGEIVTVSDPQQREYRARLTALDADSANLIPFALVPPSESPLRIHLLQALPEKERFELILQKGTEIGVSRIVPFTCRRSTTLRERDAGQKKSHRWPDVLLRAARQCRRAELPELFPVLDWGQTLSVAVAADLALLCFEGVGTLPLADALRSFSGSSIALIVGPEGGFALDEVEQAKRRGVIPIGLGPRILRTESAAIIASGIIQHVLGDLGRIP